MFPTVNISAAIKKNHPPAQLIILFQISGITANGTSSVLIRIHPFNLNIELASPGDFIPELPEWQERSRFIQQEGKLAFYHYDFYAQALAKIQRGHRIDLQDVEHLITSGLVEVKRLLELFSAIEEHLYLHPSLDGPSFRRDVERVIRESENDG